MSFFERVSVSRHRSPAMQNYKSLAETQPIRQPFRTMKDSQKKLSTTSRKPLKLDTPENLPNLGSRNQTPEPLRTATNTSFEFTIP